MLKRPLNLRFRAAVIAGEKTTTIRDKAWPVGVLIMLYNWSGAAYRSKQIDVAAVVVKGFWTIRITHLHRGGVMVYQCGKESGPALYKSEGFASQEEMDAWFRPLVKPGTTVEKTLMLFDRVKPYSSGDVLIESPLGTQQLACGNRVPVENPTTIERRFRHGHRTTT